MQILSYVLDFYSASFLSVFVKVTYVFHDRLNEISPEELNFYSSNVLSDVQPKCQCSV